MKRVVAQWKGVPAANPQTPLKVEENATCACTAMSAPLAKPDTVIEPVAMRSDGSGSGSEPATAPGSSAHHMLAASAVQARGLTTVNPL